MNENEKLDLILSQLEKLDTIEADVKDVKLTLENEIRVNIQRVAKDTWTCQEICMKQ